ncbi:hypothetical protein FUA23_07080 [Neolewinella aurantiaca]|uniref:Uncharacterized protein n=1 Tax=Neolewinella aurantiaca TaxID=2602767 RepID=A0A5C7FGY4_9BACT|nr:hypothetical protein [Neolewinella aurantiaca]TXF90275.1 hypothetical protein FUA23_07080 [Neolewinella aurantiaca]
MKYVMVFTIFLGWFFTADAQRIILDLPTKAGELTLFPEVGNDKNYYYVADKARLAVDESGNPRFSFLRYVTNATSEPGETDNTRGEGGGIVHAVVSLAVSDEQLEEARRELRQVNPDGEIIGPVIFKSGTFGLVSSFTGENGELSSQVVGLGQAPILDGQQAAVSMHLTRLGATLLWNSFQTSTPDISFSFNMTMDGYRLPKEAVIEANFEDLYESMEFGLQAGVGGTGSAAATDGSSEARGTVPVYFGADLKAQFEKLHRDGKIKVTQIGSDEGMDKLLELAYTKLADIMFDRTEAQSTSQMNPEQMMALANRGRSGGEAQQPSSPVSGITFSFSMKQKRRTGTFRMDLNKWTTDELVMRFDENIGNLSRFQGNPQYFHQINTDDELYRQREVFAVVDGYNAADFAEYINFVTVRLKKEHANGEVTHEEVVIDREKFSKKGNNFSMVYGWKGDDNRNDWMEYDHEVLWSFFGDVEVAEPLKTSSFNAINLAPPYAKREVEFQADPTFLEDQEVRLVNVKLYYTMGEKEFFKAISLNPSRNQLSEKILFVAPTDVGEYEYEVTWRLRGNRVVSSGRLTASDNVLFVDELPEEE